MSMSDDITRAIEFGWSTVVSRLRVCETSKLHVERSDCDGEGLVLSDILIVFRERNEGRRHVLFCRNKTLFMRLWTT